MSAKVQEFHTSYQSCMGLEKKDVLDLRASRTYLFSGEGWKILAGVRQRSLHA
jgi:hypothetical protein